MLKVPSSDNINQDGSKYYKRVLCTWIEQELTYDQQGNIVKIKQLPSTKSWFKNTDKKKKTIKPKVRVEMEEAGEM